jgi:alkanesulfonate monooxygenase SsuD/methylene tetrahydromethanopterin reductase-like flavin-dependent oxidoreductase (luciferase family)
VPQQQNVLLRRQLGQRDEEVQLLQNRVVALEDSQATWQAKVQQLQQQITQQTNEQHRLLHRLLSMDLLGGQGQGQQQGPRQRQRQRQTAAQELFSAAQVGTALLTGTRTQKKTNWVDVG